MKGWVIVVIIVGIFLILALVVVGNDEPTAMVVSSSKTAQDNAFDPKNSAFTVNGDEVTLVNGVSEEPVPNSSALITTRYFDHEEVGDLTGDGRDDSAYAITQETGGSGIFYYAVVAVQQSDGTYQTTNAFLIGDRIALQGLDIHEDSMELHVNYAERAEGEPMTTQPSHNVTLVLKVTADGDLVGVME